MQKQNVLHYAIIHIIIYEVGVSMNSVVVIIDGIKFDIEPAYYNITVGSLIDEAKDRKNDTALIKYLKNKYAGYTGVPYVFMEDETHLNKNTIDNWLRCELGHKGNLKDKFIPFELVSEMARKEYNG